MSARDALAAALREEGGLLAAALAPAGSPPADGLDGDALAAVTAAGPRGVRAPEDYGVTIAAVREGYRLHYGDREGDVVRPRADDDLGLLGGDRLYALGLARLAALGDLDAVVELADLISLCAQAHVGAADDDRAARELADAAWQAAAHAIGHGPQLAHTRAKERARAGEVDAEAVVRDAGRSRNLP